LSRSTKRWLGAKVIASPVATLLNDKVLRRASRLIDASGTQATNVGLEPVLPPKAQKNAPLKRALRAAFPKWAILVQLQAIGVLATTTDAEKGNAQIVPRPPPNPRLGQCCLSAGIRRFGLCSGPEACEVVQTLPENAGIYTVRNATCDDPAQMSGIGRMHRSVIGGLGAT
jgi:hypothetical protein